MITILSRELLQINEKDCHPSRKMYNGYEQVSQEMKVVSDIGKDAHPH